MLFHVGTAYDLLVLYIGKSLGRCDSACYGINIVFWFLASAFNKYCYLCYQNIWIFFQENEHCCQKMLEVTYENNDLKRKIQKLRKLLQDTINQLNLANQRKKQVENTICKQIHKTSQVLRQAKANLNSGTETELKS